jgi:RHH-type transcriptional regulator, rel operon repressor / antitoxin RelB
LPGLAALGFLHTAPSTSIQSSSARALRVSYCAKMYTSEHAMTETLSIRLDAGTKRRLDALSKRSKRSKSFLAAEAIAAYIESEEWQLGEIQAGIAELESGQEVSHEKVSKWLSSWGKSNETKAPR